MDQPAQETAAIAPVQPRPRPKRFIKNQIPDSILNDPSLNAAISLLPSNYNFEIHKCVWRVRSSEATRIALQFPEGLLMYSTIISDILTTFTPVTHCFILGDVTYGACCIDDFSCSALNCQFLIHFGHSCLVPIETTIIPTLYIFVEISLDVRHIYGEITRLNDNNKGFKSVVLAGTIQFAGAIRAIKPELESMGFKVLVPQAKPLSPGEVLGCTAPSVVTKGNREILGANDDILIVFVADGRFHLEAFMIANPGIKTYRYDPFIGKLFLEDYDHVGMKEERKRAIERAKGARRWGIVLGTLGRQGNPKILERLEGKMREKGMEWTVILMSEISPSRIGLFGDGVDAWIQIACPRLSIDWGDAFVKPLLTPFEAEIALGDLPGWWERKAAVMNVDSGCCGKVTECTKNEGCGACSTDGIVKVDKEDHVDYPMDYYAQDGGAWNSCYSKKPVRNPRRIVQSCSNNCDGC